MLLLVTTYYSKLLHFFLLISFFLSLTCLSPLFYLLSPLSSLPCFNLQSILFSLFSLLSHFFSTLPSLLFLSLNSVLPPSPFSHYLLSLSLFQAFGF